MSDPVETLHADALVIGGGVGGVAAALRLADQGWQVALTEFSTAMGHDLTSLAHPWKTDQARAELAELLQLPAGCFSADGRTLIPDPLKIALEDVLLARGVVIRYGWRAVRQEEEGVDFACKQGWCRVQAEKVINTVFDAFDQECRRLVPLTGVNVENLQPGEIVLPAELGRAFVQPGYASGGHSLLEMHWSGPPTRQAALVKARLHSREVVRWLIEHHPAFRACRLAGVGSELQTGNPDLSPLHRAQQGRGLAFPTTISSTTRRTTKTDVLVVGGGSSGAAAAIAAARTGQRVILAEMNGGLGGTGTLGGVDSYWFGRRCGFNQEVSERVAQQHAWMNWPAGAKWNVEAKMLAWLDMALEAGVEVLFGSLLLETHGEEARTVTGATFSTPDGLLDVQAQVVVDATGDADVAWRAGAGVTYGAARDSTTMWASLAQHPRPGLTKNNFTSNVDVGDPGDYTRAILNGRRRRPGHDHGTYLAPRETRHLHGAVTLSLTDQLRQRRWADVVNLAFSNHDVKGHTQSDWLRLGLIPPNLEVEVPYRAMIPAQLDGLIVTGKAISAESEALPAVRMQADLENLGYAAGLAAALSVQLGVNPRDLPVTELQKRLVEIGNLPPGLLNREELGSEPTLDGLQRWIDALDDAQPLQDLSLMDFHEVWRGPIPFVELCCVGPEVRPLLKAHLGPDSPRRVMCARVLAWHGDQVATPVLLQAAEREWPGGPLPHRGEVPFTQDSPDHGAMPNLAYLLHALALTRDVRALPLMEQVAANLDATPERLREQTSGLFHYIDALCDYAGRLGDPVCLPMLHRLQGLPLIAGQVCLSGLQPDYFLERQAMLELIVNRAAARCGDWNGYEVLMTYLDDVRRPLARHARLELATLAGQDLGAVKASWPDGLNARKVGEGRSQG